MKPESIALTDRKEGALITLVGMIQEIPGLFVRFITHPLDFFQSLKGEPNNRRALLFSVFVGLVAVVVRFGIYLPKLPNPIVFGIVLVIFPVMIILINLGTGYACYMGWKALGSKEKYPAAHACVSYISIMIPLTVALNFYFEFWFAVLVNYLLAGFLYSAASIKTHSIGPVKAITAISVLSFIQLGIYFMVHFSKASAG